MAADGGPPTVRPLDLSVGNFSSRLSRAPLLLEE
jgi:hypothetical protein